MKYYVLRLVNHKHKQVFYRVEEDPMGKDSLGHYVDWATNKVKKGKVKSMLPYHQSVAKHLAKHGRKYVEQQVIAVVNASNAQTARKQTLRERRAYGVVDKMLGYTKMSKI